MCFSTFFNPLKNEKPASETFEAKSDLSAAGTPLNYSYEPNRGGTRYADCHRRVSLWHRHQCGKNAQWQSHDIHDDKRIGWLAVRVDQPVGLDHGKESGEADG
jgi:hypothetical protein